MGEHRQRHRQHLAQAPEVATSGRWLDIRNALDDILSESPLRAIFTSQKAAELGPPPMPSVSQGPTHGVRQGDGVPSMQLHRQVDHLECFDKAWFPHLGDLDRLPVVSNDKGMFVVVAHLFAGRRRVGDIHWWMHELWKQETSEVQLFTMSLDTAIHPTLGDLTGSNYLQLLRIAQQGALAVCISGPPCESFSAARHLAPPPGWQGRRWPRPLRHPKYPWCLPGRSMRELAQAQMGSRLLLHSVKIEVLTLLGGGMSLMEHPQESDAPGRASSWRAPALRQYMRHMPFYAPNHVDQWKYEAAGVKPTRLRTAGCRGFQQAMRETEVPTATRPKEVLAGLNVDGGWKTSRAKEYPEALSHGIALGMIREIRKRIEEGKINKVHLAPQSPEWTWMEAVSDASAFVRTGATWLPDYQG